MAENGYLEPFPGKTEQDFNEIRLILSKLQDSGSRFSLKRANQTIKALFLGLLYTRLVFGLVLLGFPAAANASVISFFSDIFQSENIKQEMLIEVNSQNMALLQSVPNSDPNPSRGGGDITIVGDEALLSEVGPSGTIADIEEGRDDSIGMISTYIVQKDDTISLIAKMFNVSVSTIEWANDIKKGHYIQEGDNLIILPISGVKYTVKSGDNLKKVVAKYKGDLDEVLQYNNLKQDSTLAVGDTIIIPNWRVESVAGNAKKSKTKGANGPYYEGYYTRPLDGGRKSQGIHGWNGVDIAAPTGTPIFAAASGRVIISKNYGWNGGYGNYIVIDHPNKTQTVYGHMVKTVSEQGEYVVQGQIIGYVGSTGRSTGPHLHFEVRGARNPF